MDRSTLRAKFRGLRPVFTERSRRLWAATEARALGHGGIGTVERARGISRSTIQRGLRELERGAHTDLGPERSRRAGAGRKCVLETDPSVLADLEALVEPSTLGDPESPLRWTTKSVRELARALTQQGHTISHTLVDQLLHQLQYSLQTNVKTREGQQHADRDAQFQYINAAVRRWQRQQQPVISVDTKKKELIGDFKNSGREWRPRGAPARVRVHDFVIPEQGKAIPYGVYDLHRNEGWVSVGVDHDTASFAVNTIRRWWAVMGRAAYPAARSLMITADAGGSNGARSRLWKWELQAFANRTGLQLTVCHFPPSTSKWNTIEHRLFSFIAMNWRGKPLTDVSTIVSLIGATRSQTGLRVRSEVDRRTYPSGVSVTDEQFASIYLKPHRFHGEWNYTIHPRRRR
ncbi:MAG: ISAzo13 family transposase [Gemmatimonadota bacterium]